MADPGHDKQMLMEGREEARRAEMEKGLGRPPFPFRCQKAEEEKL